MRLAVTGREGQVVTSLAERARQRTGIEVVRVGRPDLRLDDPATIMPALKAAAPDIVVSAAAYTAVDQAEDERELAFAINEGGAGHVAAAAAAMGVPVIHLSTDYVFDGSREGPYVEDDATGPTSVYGASKLAGEHAVAAANPNHLIFRTAWVYSPFGKNFAKTILRLAGERDELTIVADQWGNPTSALDIADGILHASGMLKDEGGENLAGIYHLAGTGETNWAGFARHIVEVSARLGGPSARVRDIQTAEFPTKAARPKNSRLSTARFLNTFGWSAPDWRDSTEEVVSSLLTGQDGVGQT